MKTVTLSNEVNEILSALKQESETKKAILKEFPEKRETELENWFNKSALIGCIEGGHITNVNKINQILKLIEAIKNTKDVHHNFILEYSVIVLESSLNRPNGNAIFETRLDFINDSWEMNKYGNKVDSIETILNTIHTKLVRADLSDEMNEIVKELDKASCGTAPFEELPETEQSVIAHKLQLKKVIESGIITEVEKAKKWVELIEAINEGPITDEYYNVLAFFDDGSVLIQFFAEGYEDQFYVDFANGKLILNDEVFAPISSPSLEGEDLSSSIDYLLYHLTELDFLMNLHCR